MNNKQKLELTWIGKGKEPKLEHRILFYDKEKSYGDQSTGNMLIHGDNLLALKALEQDYAGEIKCIYIDPPYNTGNAFEHYDDSLEHSIWLDLLYERILILYKLLKNDGMIFIHLDSQEVHYCKIIMDEVFGRSNFVTQITYERSAASGIAQGASIVNTGEYILVYKKEILDLKDISVYNPIDIKTMKRYNKILLNFGERELVNEFESKSNGETVKVFRHKNYTIESFSFKNYEKNKKNIDKEYADNYDKLFRTFLVQKENSFQQELIKDMDKNNLYSIEYIPSRGKNKDKLTNLYYYNKELVGWLRDSAKLEDDMVVKGNKLTNIWIHSEIPKADLPNEGGVSFPRSKKPEQLIERILEMSTKEGDIVLDSFLGSGTTAAVAHKLNRRWVGIELGEHCYTHCISRLQKVINGEDKSGISKKVNWNGGGGFKFYELAPSLLKKDKFGNWVIDKEHYNSEMLSAAVAKLNGYKYCPDENVFWKQGVSHENSYIFTTTKYITATYLDMLSKEIRDDENLLICCSAFDTGLNDRYDNIIIKKIPQSVLDKCDFGISDYNMNIVNLTDFESEDEYDE